MENERDEMATSEGRSKRPARGTFRHFFALLSTTTVIHTLACLPCGIVERRCIQRPSKTPRLLKESLFRGSSNTSDLADCARRASCIRVRSLFDTS